MGLIKTLGRYAWRKFSLDGVASSSFHQPEHADIFAFVDEIDANIDALSEAGTLRGGWDASSGVFPGGGTAALGDAWLVETAGTTGGVTFGEGDRIVAIIANASTSLYAGNWQVIRARGRAYIPGTDAGAGTANAVQITTPEPVIDGSVVMFQLFRDTTASPVTVSANGGTALTLKTNRGNDASGLTAGMDVWFRYRASDNTARMLNDQDVSALVAQAEAAAALAESWAEGTEPGGALTKSSKEWALVAQGAVTYNRSRASGTINAGVGPYDAGVAIGSPNNIDIKIGGVIQDHDAYTVDGTTFTFLVAPPADEPWESIVHSEVRQLGTVSDGSIGTSQLQDNSVTKAKMGPGVLNSIITADMFGAVFDGTPGDLDKIHTAAITAAADGVPFVVPNQGFAWDTTASTANTGLTIQVPEDFPTIQAAHDAMLNWIFPATPPRQADTTQNHVLPTSVTIDVADSLITMSGKNITWNHPCGDRIVVKGRYRTVLTLASQQSITYSGGVHLLTLRFSDWPAVDPVVGSMLRIVTPSGSGEYRNFAGGWRITAVDAVNKDITVAIYALNDAVALSGIVSGGTFLHLPTTIHYTNMPSSGADVGGFDVHTTLRLADIGLRGDATNAASTNGIVVRKCGRLWAGQFVAIAEFQRSGIWAVADCELDIAYVSSCGNGSHGVNNLHSRAIGNYTDLQGNAGSNYLGGVGSSASITNSQFGGAGDSGIRMLNNSSGIFSGASRRSVNFGVEVEAGAFANINDMNVRVNGVTDVKRHLSGRIQLSSNDAGTFDPALDTNDVWGGWTALSATLS